MYREVQITGPLNCAWIELCWKNSSSVAAPQHTRTHPYWIHPLEHYTDVCHVQPLWSCAVERSVTPVNSFNGWVSQPSRINFVFPPKKYWTEVCDAEILDLSRTDTKQIHNRWNCSVHCTHILDHHIQWHFFTHLLCVTTFSTLLMCKGL